MKQKTNIKINDDTPFYSQKDVCGSCVGIDAGADRCVAAGDQPLYR